MHRLTVDPPWDAEAWRAQARQALRSGWRPDQVEWGDARAASLFGAASQAPTADGGGEAPAPRVPRAFLPLASRLVAHRATGRHALPYRLLWRLLHGESSLLARATDPDMHRALAMAREIRRELHKAKAFVRFNAVPGEDDAYVAWFEPAHDILDAVAPFFAARFAGMRWSILTPYRGAHWNGAALRFGPGASRADAPGDDALQTLWLEYYGSIFNPARLNLAAMRREMPVRYWANLPEARLIPALARSAGQRSEAMVERPPTRPNPKARAARGRNASSEAGDVPPAGGLAALRQAAAACRACELWKDATQTVFGEGPARARVVVVGEQPGDEEDLRGRPFVGPAGKLFDEALAELGLDRASLYVTNAVKHFRFEQRGKFRLHRSPSAAHVRACHGWLEGELARIRPDVVVCLGAIAAKAVFGNAFGLMRQRGQWQDLGEGRRGFATVHPSWVLRQRDRAARDAAYAGFVEDLAMLGSMRTP